MTSSSSFRCSCCAQPHDGPPLSYAAPAPVYWHAGLEHQPGNMLEGERCVIGGTHFFIRARLVLPIVETGDEFEWGVWVSVSEQSFGRMSQLWDKPERVEEPPYFGWLATELTPYEPTTLNLKTNLHTQPVGIRPLVELEPTNHPLAIEQCLGITLSTIQSIAERLLHPPIQ